MACGYCRNYTFSPGSNLPVDSTPMYFVDYVLFGLSFLRKNDFLNFARLHSNRHPKNHIDIHLLPRKRRAN